MKKKLTVIIYIVCFVISFLSCSQEGRIITDVPIDEVDQTDTSNDVGEETDMEVSSLGEIYNFFEDTIINSIQIKHTSAHTSEPNKNINLNKKQSESLFRLLTDMNCSTLKLNNHLVYENLPEYIIHIKIERDGEIFLHTFQFGKSYLIYNIFTSGKFSYNKHQINIDDYDLIKTFIEEFTAKSE